MSNRETTFDRLLRWLKERKLIAALAVAGVVVIGFGAVTGSLSSIWDFLERVRSEDIGSTADELESVAPSQNPAAALGEQPHRALELTLEEYFERLADDGRFLERQEWLDSMIGERVRWSGYVDSIRRMSPSTRVAVSVRSTSTNPFQFIIVSFPEEWETKLFSLQEGDRIEVEAIVQTPADLPMLEGLSLTVLEPADQSEQKSND